MEDKRVAKRKWIGGIMENSWRNWDDVLDPRNRPALERLLKDRDAVYTLLDQVSRADFSMYCRDEAHFLELLSLMARHAHWIEGELHIAINVHRVVIRSCAVSLISADGKSKLLLKKVIFPSSFFEFQLLVADLELIKPLRIRSETTEQKILLLAPRTMGSHERRAPAPLSGAAPSASASTLTLDIDDHEETTDDIDARW